MAIFGVANNFVVGFMSHSEVVTLLVTISLSGTNMPIEVAFYIFLPIDECCSLLWSEEFLCQSGYCLLQKLKTDRNMENK